jgi:hypothetical protein
VAFPWMDFHFHLGPDNTGRLRVVEAISRSNLSALDVNDWRSAPIAAVEELANRPENYEAIVAHLDDTDNELVLPAAAMDVLPREQPQVSRRRLRVPKPKGKKYPDSHYERVAEAYWVAVGLRLAPGPTIAAVNHVPETTARRWIAEARRRKLLAPAGERRKKP